MTNFKDIFLSINNLTMSELMILVSNASYIVNAFHAICSFKNQQCLNIQISKSRNIFEQKSFIHKLTNFLNEQYSTEEINFTKPINKI